jgi:hypothetical protein
MKCKYPGPLLLKGSAAESNADNNMYNYDPTDPMYKNWYLDVVESTNTSYTFEIKCKTDSSTNAYLQQISKNPAAAGGPARACPPVRLPWCTSQNAKFNSLWCQTFPVLACILFTRWPKIRQVLPI